MSSGPPDVDLSARLGPLLIANRGEIAVRVQRTARDLGLETVAVFTDADAGAPHVRAADRAERIPSYLDVEAIVAAAARAGAGSIHPGFGFLSESAGFARAIAAAGLSWVGPPPEAIELMGDKGASKRLAAESGVPVVPGLDEGESAEPGRVEAFATEHGYPLVVKALAGGGGKGMRVVAGREELAGALASAAREAEAAFGDGRVLVERYLERPRHIEIQVLADSHGTCLHLGERECSLQRRHQKVIEEAPSPVVDEEVRERMGAAAVALARACDYEGAGTVEFIVPADLSGFHFLEMNTRLQVEHPVTEMVWGVDLVAEQLRVAAGEPLRFGPAELEPSGHAVEARIYAEEPASGFLPASGRILRWREPRAKGVRVDSGVTEGEEVGTGYDPMLAKVIAHGGDRAEALGRLDRALGELQLLGVASNTAFCRAILRRAEVRVGELDTGLLERVADELDHEAPADLQGAAAVALWSRDVRPWAQRAERAGPWRRRLEGVGDVLIAAGTIRIDDGSAVSFEATESAGGLEVELEGERRNYAVAEEETGVWVGRDGHQLHARPHQRARTGTALEGSLEAPMPGTVLAVEVAEGEEVAEGDVLVVLESMKMELQITAPRAGRIEGLTLSVGDQVAKGEALVAVSGGEEEG